MSNRPHLPPETLDYIVDLLHDEPETLERCCLVSKSWMPRTRKHLFADVKFRSTQDVDSWKTAFPDHSNSPAYHTHTLFVCWTRVEADAWAGGLIQTFSHVVRLRLTQATFGTPSIVKQFSLAPFHNLSPTLKSLHVYFVSLPCTQLFDFVRSSPLLEDLALSGRDLSSGNDDTPREPQAIGPWPSPVFTESLDLDIMEGVGNIAHRLLDLPGGLHFRKLTFSWAHEEDLRWMIELVRKCSGTLECLDVKCHPPCTFVLVLRWPMTYFVSRWLRSGFHRPLKSDKTQGCRLSAWIAHRHMDRRGTPNNFIQTSRSQTYFDPRPLRLHSH